MNLLEWNEQDYIGGKGVLTGCDERLEWMLKWWWKHYSQSNKYPVTLFNFGMTPCARKWCELHFQVIPFCLDSSLIPKKETVSKDIKWPSKMASFIWSVRPTWFSKALCLPQTPYESNIWIDIDCEVKKTISPLFSLCEGGDGFAVALDTPFNIQIFRGNCSLTPQAKGYQTGVFAFKRKSPVVNAWLDRCYHKRNQEFSEQSALCHTLHEANFNFTQMSNHYNWLLPEKENREAVIIHHTGASRKRKLIFEVL